MAAATAPASFSSSSGWDFTCNFDVDYGSEGHASIVYKTLVVDKELQPDMVRREMTVSGGKLVVRFKAVEARFLRASFSAFVDLMVLVTKLVEEYSLQPDKVRREMTVSGGMLVVRSEAVEARFLRASFSAFVDLMVLVTKLVEEYGVSKEEHSAL